MPKYITYPRKCRRGHKTSNEAPNCGYCRLIKHLPNKMSQMPPEERLLREIFGETKFEPSRFVCKRT